MANTLIIAPREKGKTTTLLKQALSTPVGTKIYVMDSATEHTTKSLLVKMTAVIDDYYIINPKDKNDIVLECDNIENYIFRCKNSNLYREMQNNYTKNLFFDLAYFLEEGFVFADAGNVQKSKKYRLLYDYLCLQVATCIFLLSIKYNLKINVYSDEIEFPNTKIGIYDLQKKSNVNFISAVHKENAFGEFYKHFEIVDLHNEIMGTKSADLLCGPALLEYLFKIHNINMQVPQNEVWCCNLASTLIQNGFDAKVHCYNSKLYDDAIKNKNVDFDGFNSVNNFLLKNKILQVQPTQEELSKEINQNQYCIFNVASNIFHSEPNMTGGHYVLAVNECGKIYLINPTKEHYIKQKLDLDLIVKAIKDCGGWRILINKK